MWRTALMLVGLFVMGATVAALDLSWTSVLLLGAIYVLADLAYSRLTRRAIGR